MLIDFLPKGKDNAMTGRELSQRLNTSNRKIRFEIERLRREGVVICSSSRGKKGYYIPDNEHEKEEFLKQYESYIKQMRRTLYDMRGY